MQFLFIAFQLNLIVAFREHLLDSLITVSVKYS